MHLFCDKAWHTYLDLGWGAVWVFAEQPSVAERLSAGDSGAGSLVGSAGFAGLGGRWDQRVHQPRELVDNYKASEIVNLGAYSLRRGCQGGRIDSQPSSLTLVLAALNSK